MEYLRDNDGSVCNVILNGEFSFSDHNSFREIFSVFTDSSINQVNFNIKGLTFVDSAALGLFLLARDEAAKGGKSLRIISPQGQVKKMLEISRFYELFDVVD